jgi:hypothetical protein
MRGLFAIVQTPAAETVTGRDYSSHRHRDSRSSCHMAIRLEKVFGSTADTWLRMQMQRDLSEVRQRADEIKVKRRFAAAKLC